MSLAIQKLRSALEVETENGVKNGDGSWKLRWSWSIAIEVKEVVVEEILIYDRTIFCGHS